MIPSPETVEVCRDGIHFEFLRSCLRYADRPCVDVLHTELTYAQVYEQAAAIAATLRRLPAPDGPPLAAVVAERSATAVIGLLGILMSGRGAVPLSPAFPADRTRGMLEDAGARVLVTERNGLSALRGMLESAPAGLTVLLPDQEADAALAAALPQHRFIGSPELAPAADWRPVRADPDAVAYLLFTSGSTGKPKGVPLLHRNLTYFLREGLRRFRFDANDRFLQVFDLTWDAHIFSLWAGWAAGACVCVPQAKQLITLGAFLVEKNVTVSDVVPSLGRTMLRMGTLSPGRFPRLRYIRLGSEAVPVEQAVAWAEAAPQARLDNAYGPTECTVEVTFYDWDPQTSPAESEAGIVPIGYPCPGVKLLVVDEHLAEVPPGAVGELLIGGPQVAPGYWKDPRRTAEAFIVPPGQSEVFYRTGDLVRQPAPGKPLCFLGRRDNQVKIFGVRVELGDVEAALRKAAGTQLAVAVGWPKVPTGVAGIVAFLDQPQADAKAILAELRSRLPPVMVPREIRLLDAFPLNANGKIDRLALLRTLEEK